MRSSIFSIARAPRPASIRGPFAPPARRWRRPTRSSSRARRAGPRPSPRIGSRTSRAWPSATSATSRKASTGTRPISRSCCIRSRPTSRRASTRCSPAPTRKRARATRASCSATPARETPELMPAPIYYAHKILHDLAKARHAKEGAAALLGPDSKSQVTVRYEDGKPVGVTQIVVSHQHIDEDLPSTKIREIVEPYVRKALPQGLDRQGHGLARQSDGQVLHRRPRRRLRAHRPQDHRRHLRRRGPARRRRLLRQGPDQGRPLGGLCGALSRQERGGGGACRPLHHPALLCHRRRQAAVDLCRHPRHRQGRRGQARDRRWARSWT